MRKSKPIIDHRERLCRFCAHSHSPYSPSLKGEPTLARCPFREFAVLLNHDTCERFTPKR